MLVKRSQEEIDNTLNKCADAFDNGTMWPGMSYEQGVMDALNWILGHDDEDPMEEYVMSDER